MLLTTQYLEEADRLADNIVVIDHGRVIAEGTSSQLKARLGATIVEVGFADPATAQRAQSELARIGLCDVGAASTIVESKVDDGARSCSRSFAASITPRLEPATLTVREPTLDDVFLSLTGHKAEEPVAEDAARRSRPPPNARCSMTAIAVPTTIERPKRSAFSWAVHDALTVTWRNLVAMKRTPQVLVFSTIQPIIFVLMFRYVFGGAIRIPGVDHYVDYLMPGVFAQTVVFGSIQTGVGLAEDLHTGLIERFQSLPMARSAVLAGRTLADLVRNVFVVMLMVGVGFIVGWRIHTNVLGLVGGIAVMLLFAHSLSWVFALVGLTAANAEAAQAASFPILAPLVFASTAFVSAASMPAPLEWFANHQPVSIVIDAVRALTYGGQFASTSKVLGAIAWSLAIIAIAAPLAVSMYRRKV